MEKTVLLVDDEQDIREVVGSYLSDMGYTVHVAGSGKEALGIFRELNPPVVLTDIKMPAMDGIELLQKIKLENPDAEVVMITGHGDMDLAVKSLKHEATDFICKPIDVDALEIALKRVRERIIIRRQLKEYTESLEALLKEKTELQDHLSSLGLMITSISHGIKGLLTGLDGGMYMLQSGMAKEDPAEIKRGWEVAKITAGRIRKMVLDILFYAKERDLNWERVNALGFAQDVATVFEPKVKGQEIDFVHDFDPTLGEFEVDPGLIHSALINILENAVDACTKDKGKNSHKIVFGVRQEKDNIVFDVFDNGIGMDRETREKIFTLFYSSKGRKGTGLGLFISDKIVKQHGGEIKIKSTPGQGSQFSIIIPKIIPESVKNNRVGKNWRE